MKSYVKIYGPPVLKAIKALEKIAIDMPEVCIWNTLIEAADFPIVTEIETVTETELGTVNETVRDYFELGEGELPEQRCGKIISKSGEKVGEYDFYFEWFKDPNVEELNNLIEKIDGVLDPLGCKYTITTK